MVAHGSFSSLILSLEISSDSWFQILSLATFGGSGAETCGAACWTNSLNSKRSAGRVPPPDNIASMIGAAASSYVDNVEGMNDA